MNEQPAGGTLKRTVNIASAIDKSSFQMPVFVAISAEGGEAQVVKTFATAREVFDHVFSILLDRIRQRRAVEAVEGLVPRSAHLTTSRDTEYVLLVRGKAIFWFSGAAAKRAAGRRLLLEHARDLAEAEQAPFYVLNSRPKKLRAAIAATALIIMIAAGFLLKPFAVHWIRAPTRQQAGPTPRPGGPANQRSRAPKPLTDLGIRARADKADRAATPAAAAAIASRLAPPPGAAHPKRAAPDVPTTISKQGAGTADFARAWPDRFDDRLLFPYSYLDAETGEAPAGLDRPVITRPPVSATVAEKRARVLDPGMTRRTPGPGEPKP